MSLPHPPRSNRDLPLVQYPAGSVWYRIHDVARSAIHFGRHRTNRFDDSFAAFGVLYAAKKPHGAFVETFVRDPNGAAPAVSEVQLKAKELSIITIPWDIRLVDLTGAGLVQLGVDSRLFSTTNYSCTQRWAHALYTNQSQPCGLLYPCRHDPSQVALALFERPMTAGNVQGTLLGPLLNRNQLLPEIEPVMTHYRVAIL